MSEKELEGVLAHEVSHIANGDMVTMTLLQGVVNAFVMFLARVLAFALSARHSNNKGRSVSSFYYLFVFLFEIVFMILGSMVIAFYSRYREFRADKGGAFLAGKDKMIAALESLKKTTHVHDPAAEKPALQAFKISPSKGRGIWLFLLPIPL
ncbi:MAG: M48 family metalloprotease [Rhabdochlamydiaceae bacterium]|jgi:heat shock protein HtpX